MATLPVQKGTNRFKGILAKFELRSFKLNINAFALLDYIF